MGVAPVLWVKALLVAAGAGQTIPSTVPPPDPPTAAAALLEGATLIDSTVAIVDRRVITLSLLDQEARLAFVEHGAIDDTVAPLDAGKRRAALSYLINQLLLENEAARLQVFEVSDQESANAQKALQSRFPSPAAFRAFLVRFDISPESLDQSVRRRLRAERYLADRLRLLDSSSHTGAGKDVSGQVETILQDIRSRHDVRVLTDFVAESPTPTGQSALPPKLEGDGGRPSTWGQVR
jgi:hypothetical protein